MIEKIDYSCIDAAVKEALAKKDFQSIEKVLRTLKTRIKSLKSHYARANLSEERRPVDEWLCDNYYVLEKETKQSLKDIRAIIRKGGKPGLAKLYAVVEAALFSCLPPVCDETITFLLNETQKSTPLSEKQFSFIPYAVKAAFVNMAYVACIETGMEKEIKYAITGISKLSAVDFESIVQDSSTVERTLLNDPAGIYENMSAESRQHYRHLIAEIAAKKNISESRAAKEKLELAKNAKAPLENHIGYGIVGDPGLRALRHRRGVLMLWLEALIPLLASVLAGILTRNAMVGLLCYFPLWEVFRTPLSRFALAGVDVDFIPRMDLLKIPDKPKTVVLVSTLLPKAADAPALEKRLLQLYFSNSDPDLYYCILADFKEWDFPVDEKDESQIEAAKKVVEGLNSRYNGRFMLFLRGRVFNKTQKKYSGWERKRGAITEFIRFLKGEKTSVHTFVGDREVCPSIRYIIALDSDTNMLYESAETLVSAAIHPLNAPVTGENGIVTRGYGILTPKMSADLNSAKATAFSRVLSGCGGVTAYDTRDKDFYQDLFGESIFAGKGLIDIDAFYAVLNDRFPENQILSHDILEGAYLRAGFVSDVEMTDGTPSNMIAWISRLHRWTRGDWQNIRFIGKRYKVDGKVYENPVNALSKYKMFDNLRRSATPVISLFCIVAAVFMPRAASLILALSGTMAVTLASIWAAVSSLLTGGFFTLSRKFFTRTLPHTLELLGQALIFLIMLPAQAFSSLDAIFRSLWRSFVTRKKLLEWTTAAQSDMRKVSVAVVAKRYFLPEIFGILYFFLTPNSTLSLLGIAFALVMPVAYYTARPTEEEKRKLSSADRDALVSYNAAMWRYYEDFANRENNFLPPDNIQQSPVFRVAARTSPTNIGMLLLSVLAARDLDFIDTKGLYTRIERTIGTVEKLKTWHGNLINWYDTNTLDTLKPEFVSTVDSGNFIACLVALKEGLREFTAEKRRFAGLISRIEKLIDQADLTAFYDKRKKLFSIGYDVESGKLVDSYYDFLMSEARLTSYLALARKIVGKKHWGALNRTMSRSGSYAGAVSWTGTMFEYYMPHLLLPVYDGSLLGEALTYCLYCQKKRAKSQNVPWGISESAFYAFDNNLNYQYKAHGVGKLGVKRYLDRELVISPYSTFITIPQNPNSSMQNLKKLRELGVYGRYGFFEAVDFTAGRVGAGALCVTRSYMAHHIGMSMVASCNALFENRMQERFMKDNDMKSAVEFLQEKIAKNTVVYDEMKNTEGRGEKHERPKIKEATEIIYPQSPRCYILTNGEITDVLTDSGAGYLKFGGIDLLRREGDLLRRAQGFFALVYCGGEVISATKAPFYDKSADYRVEQDERSVTYISSKKQLEVGMRCMIHPTISCEQRQIVIKNNSQSKKNVEVLIYFEPVLSGYCDYAAHPAYSKLFVTSKYDRDSKTLTYTRRNRDGGSDLFLTVGFLQDDFDFSFETARENLMSAPNGMSDLLDFYKKEYKGHAAGVPDACCALKFSLTIGANSQQQATVLLAATRTEAEGAAAIISMRKSGLMEPENAAVSPLLGDSLESRMSGSMLGQLLFTRASCEENLKAKSENGLGQSGLWGAGISGDAPIALMELDADFDETAPVSYIKIHSSLRSLSVEFDLCIVYEDEPVLSSLTALIEKYSVTSILGARGGIFLLKKSALQAEILTLLRSTARHTATEKPVPLPEFQYHPVKIKPVFPVGLPRGIEVNGGVFKDGKFYVSRKTPLPFCHVLANPVFGTLVSDSALGFTWASSSRENKLTPWYNDICTDNTGELLILKEEGGYHNLVKGARASFSVHDAVYDGTTEKLSTKVRVSVAPKGFMKLVDVELHNNTNAAIKCHAAYYIEPVLGVSRDTARHISVRQTDAGLLMQNPYGTAVRGFAALRRLRAAGTAPVLINDRAAFLCGKWDKTSITPQNDTCAAVIIPVKLNPYSSETIRFALSFGKTESAALFVPAETGALYEPENSFVFETPDEHLNAFLNGFAVHQIYGARMLARCGFYQCGGAYGFRDQLQDAASYVFIGPKIARRHIIRCCAAQFEEGDVLHWWHNLPKSAGGIKGVRTRFSDDLLWLAYVVSEYIEKTGDIEILSVPVRYLSAQPLRPNENEKYISPKRSDVIEDVFSHCVRALEKGYNVDEFGLPFIGCGDWCDGFSSVGLGGRGTSVWLALFLSQTLEKFAKICVIRGKSELSEKYLEWSQSLKKAVDIRCWDGAWYVRAFYDNGERMGSRDSSECRIDLLPQAFAVLAGMPDKDRVDTGLKSAVSELVSKDLRLVKLFTKPFQHCREQPGYVKAYPSGIRENGGQYTHSAVWLAIALLEWGKTDEGFKIIEMLNPANRALFPELMEKYKLEPYYMPADIYTNKNAEGRGGWSIYTGAVSWYYRAVLEYLLGFKLCGGYAVLKPKLPSGWNEAKLSASVCGTPLEISFLRGEKQEMLLDGAPAERIPLDGKRHDVKFIAEKTQ
ncbi:MAG: hypothetical protein FWG94_04305 [Oscillospiraceae bacterium]|nr:hypothetical protein [Oscillospiraceae bacterium]